MTRQPPFSVIVRSTFLPVLLGLFAGVTGSFMAESYLAADSLRLPEPLQVGRPTVSVTAPMPQVEIAGRLVQLNLPVHLKRSIRAGDAADRALDAQDAIGYAAAVTSDGWLATHQSILASGPVVVAANGTLHEPSAQVSDPATGLVFLKIDVSALQVSGFEETEILAAGTSLYAEDDGRRFAPAVFSGAAPDRGAASSRLGDSDRFWRTYRLDRAFTAKAAGGAVLTSGGNLAGILIPAKDGDATFVPTHRFRTVLSDVFRARPVARASLGVRYLDLGAAAFSGEPPAQGTGSLVAGSRREGLAAVKPGSAAARAGLAEGDVLLRIGETELGGEADLSEAVAGYAPGAKVRLELLRDEGRETLEVTLD